MKMRGKENLVTIAARIDAQLYKHIENYVNQNPFYTSMSDFIRDAIAEKIKIENPEYFQAILKNITVSKDAQSSSISKGEKKT